MQPRLLLIFLIPLGLSSCFGPSQAGPEVYPYGPPRYGHGGTDSPPPPPRPFRPAPIPQPAPNQGGGLQWQNQNQGQVTQQGRSNQVPIDPPPAPTPTPAPAPNVPDPAPVAKNDPPPANTTSGGGSSGGSTPYGIPVPGKDGMLYSPFKPDAGFIDITTRNPDGSSATLPPGTKIKDPFSGKAILVP